MSENKKPTIAEIEALLDEPNKHVYLKADGSIDVIDYEDKIKQLQAELDKANEKIQELHKQVEFWMSEDDGSTWPPENTAWRKLLNVKDKRPEQIKEMQRLVPVIMWKTDAQLQYERAKQLQAELDKANTDKQELCSEAIKQNEIACRLRDKLFEHRWIPVEERLPKKDGNIVLYKKSKPMVMHYFTNRTSEQWLMGFTHWKPEIPPERALKEVKP